MITKPVTGTTPAPQRPTQHAPQVADNLTLMLTARRRRHLRRTSW